MEMLLLKHTSTSSFTHTHAHSYFLLLHSLRIEKVNVKFQSAKIPTLKTNKSGEVSNAIQLAMTVILH